MNATDFSQSAVNKRIIEVYLSDVIVVLYPFSLFLHTSSTHICLKKEGDGMPALTQTHSTYEKWSLNGNGKSLTRLIIELVHNIQCACACNEIHSNMIILN